MYRKLLILALAAFVCTPQVAQAHTTKSAEIKKDTITVLSEVAVVAKMKQKNNLREESLSSTTIKLGEIELMINENYQLAMPALMLMTNGSRKNHRQFAALNTHKRMLSHFSHIIPPL